MLEEDTCSLLVGVQTGAATVETSVEALQKPRNRLSR